MDTLPIMLKMVGQPALVVGGGDIGARKARWLLRAGAAVTVLSPEINRELQALVRTKDVKWLASCFDPQQLATDWRLVVGAALEDVNHQVAQWAQTHGVLCNIVDSPALCDFYMPAVVDRSPLLVAIGTGGAHPVLARAVRTWIENGLPNHFGKIAAAWSGLRAKSRAWFRDIDARRLAWDKLLVGDRWRQMPTADDETRLAALATTDHVSGTGKVVFVGAGPGNPDLVTRSGHHWLQMADVVLHDRLAAPVAQALARRDAELIDVGKRAGQPSTEQGFIDRLLVTKASEHAVVVRLKGGDSGIFGRLDEELAALAAANIEFEIVPGVTAASVMAAAMGNPLTQRIERRGVMILTAHDTQWPPWQALASSQITTVIYMGARRAKDIARRLLAAGAPANFRVAVGSNLSIAAQALTETDLGSLSQTGLTVGRGPTLLVINPPGHALDAVSQESLRSAMS